jgi:hypothetical protein
VISLTREELRAMLEEAAEKGAQKALRALRKQRRAGPADPQDADDREWALRQARRMGLRVNE